ncbi:MAG TPA: hypothetical protein VLA89_06115 [Gemmatimonadales bacterium]|nr:hypothetical protein [Gemmatimonadales bacterium]
MSAHTYHPDSHENGLADDCPRCEEHAENPILSLDNENLHELVRRVVAGEKGRSRNESAAMDNVRRALDQTCALAVANQLDVMKYMRERWHITLVSQG